MEDKEAHESSSYGGCFFCLINSPKTSQRRVELSRFFNDMPTRDDPDLVLVMCALWSAAMSNPDDQSLPSADALRCAVRLLRRSLSDARWLRRHQNIYIPYYAAHILGSYTFRSHSLAAAAVTSGAIPPLVELLRGRLSWIEQRVAVRALGHIASYTSTFSDVATFGSGVVVQLAMRTATAATPPEIEEYQIDLLTRGTGGAEVAAWRAEEWAGQLRRWSFYLLSCFAAREEHYRPIICNSKDFLAKLGNMFWQSILSCDGGGNSCPAAPTLMRILCRSKSCRTVIIRRPEVIHSLCSLSSSSNTWQYMGIDCLLLLLNDENVRNTVIEVAAPCLTDLIELRNLGPRKNLGDVIAKALLPDVNSIRGRASFLAGDIEAAVEKKKKEGKHSYIAGDITSAAEKYGEALQLFTGISSMERRKQRMVLYSNRAQCWLLLRRPCLAASDATRALCLAAPVNSHAKSLWRRAQAYDAMGMANESLVDCLSFVRVWRSNGESDGNRRREKTLYYALRMIAKQMNAIYADGVGDKLKVTAGT